MDRDMEQDDLDAMYHQQQLEEQQQFEEQLTFETD